MNKPVQNPYHWLTADSLAVAPMLLGLELVSQAGGAETAGRIVEVEAYHGAEDPASHAFRGLTSRTAPMFSAGGLVYVYLSYGIHTCVNVVTGPAGVGQAVLIRALEPTIGLDIMQARRHTTNRLNLASGPGKLTQALGISLSISGSRLGETLSLRPPSPSPGQTLAIATSPRIGITKAAENPWRFFLRDNPYVSR